MTFQSVRHLSQTLCAVSVFSAAALGGSAALACTPDYQVKAGDGRYDALVPDFLR